jgi:hypothetical protein
MEQGNAAAQVAQFTFLGVLRGSKGAYQRLSNHLFLFKLLLWFSPVPPV